MPPRLGLYSLADTPEDLLSQGYGMVNTEFADDPAFGGLAYNTAYNPAPYTGAMPFQNVFRISEGVSNNFDNPSYGGSGNPRFNQFGKDIEFINAPQDIYPAAVPPNFINAPQDYYQPDLTTLRGLDMNRFQGVSDRSIIDETTNDEQGQNYIDQVNKNKSTGIMDLIMSIAAPGYGFLKNIGKGGFDGIRGLNQRIQQSDFGQSDNFAEFLKRRRDKEALARDPNVFRDARNITSNLRRTDADNVIDRGRGESNIASRAPKGPTGTRRGIDSRNRSSIDPAVGRKG